MRRLNDVAGLPAIYRERHWATLAVAALIAFAVVPLLVKGPYGLGIANFALIYALLTVGFQIVYGLSGQFSFAHGALFALGASSSAWAAGSSHFWLGFITAVVVTAAVGAAFKMALSRTSATYFAIATFAFNSILLVILQNWESFTGGFGGRTRLPKPSVFGWRVDTPLRYYVLYAALLLCGVALSILIQRSPFRRDMIMARDMPRIAASIGIRVRRLEVVAFAVGAGYAGAAGSMYAHVNGFVNSFSFSGTLSLTIFLMLLLGGLTSVWGAVLGALFLTWLPERLRSVNQNSELVYALLVLAVIVFFPQGVAGLVRLVRRSVRGRPRAA
jgi:branched-chain amino acid transport system permease protein